MPSDSAECLAFTKFGFELSERYDTPVILGLSTRVSHTRGLCELGEREEHSRPYKKDIKKYVMMPAMARVRHEFVEQRIRDLAEWAETSEINRIEINSTKIGVITSGAAYQYAREALGDRASYLKLGLVNPLPVRLIQDFAGKVDVLYVVEELDDVIETHCKKIGVNVIGKALFSFCGELTQNVIAEKIKGRVPEQLGFNGDMAIYYTDARNVTSDGFNIEVTVNDAAKEMNPHVIVAYAYDRDSVPTAETVLSGRFYTQTRRLTEMRRVNSSADETTYSVSLRGRPEENYYLYVILKKDMEYSNMVSYSVFTPRE